MSVEAVIWHDLECGSYDADLPYWRALADHYGGPILDVGAGTGRVAIELARGGHAVVALERDHELADELERRSGGGMAVRREDACAFTLAEPVALCIVAMQTLHLFEDRGAFLRCARAALRAGGVLAVALLGEGVEPFELELQPDVVVLAGVRYESVPTALRMLPAPGGRVIVLERRRSSVGIAAPTRTAIDQVRLHDCDAATLIAEAAAVGFASLGVDRIPPTDEHVGSQIVRLEAVP